jgi:hypothetical protein
VNLQQLRDYVRTQLDVDEEELPNALLDSYFTEAFDRTIALETRWPFYETRWAVAYTPSEALIILPEDCDPAGIMALIDLATGVRLLQISNEAAEDTFVGGQQNGSGTPASYSIYGSKIVLWPTPGENERQYHLRGYRLSHDWMLDGASAEPDCDKRLHILFAHYAIALAYAQQEDEVLEDVYMKRWQNSFVSLHAAICKPRHHRPLVLNLGVPSAAATANPVIWGPPVGP